MNWKHRKVIELVALHGYSPENAYKQIYKNVSSKWAKIAASKIFLKKDSTEYYEYLIIGNKGHKEKKLENNMLNNNSSNEINFNMPFHSNPKWGILDAFNELEEMRSKLIENKQYFQASRLTKEKYEILGLRDSFKKIEPQVSTEVVNEVQKEIINIIAKENIEEESPIKEGSEKQMTHE